MTGSIPNTESLACQDFPIRCYESVTLFDYLFWVPFESLDAMRNDATIVGVIGWSSQL